MERKGGEDEAKEGRWWSSKLEMADERTIPPEVFSGIRGGEKGRLMLDHTGPYLVNEVDRVKWRKEECWVEGSRRRSLRVLTPSFFSS